MYADRLEDRGLQEIWIACSYLFPLDFTRDKDFLLNLNLETLKRAYRERAKDTHPDLHPDKKMSEHFRKVQHSYELLTAYLNGKARHPQAAVHASEEAILKRKIIAVGGAKGGVGKSIFSANLGVFLASQGFKTVVIDLDLGGANIHLYLGKKSLMKQNINDFLKKRVHTLEELMVESEYGPLLIGGDSSELGAANVEFARKLRLIRAIQDIEADYIILDLGGDTTYNIIDFFLQADYGIVVTTRDSASYVSAYHFIKAALYRKLNRLFGPESKFRNERDTELERLIHDLTMSSEGMKVKTIEQLVEKVRQRHPLSLSTVTKAVSAFQPYLVVNKIPKETDVHQTVTKVQDVSQKWLSREVIFLGGISTQLEIEKSVIDLVPVVARHPKGKLATEIGHITQRLFHNT